MPISYIMSQNFGEKIANFSFTLWKLEATFIWYEPKLSFPNNIYSILTIPYFASMFCISFYESIKCVDSKRARQMDALLPWLIHFIKFLKRTHTMPLCLPTWALFVTICENVPWIQIIISTVSYLPMFRTSRMLASVGLTSLN
jgi:hypothetical protein